MTEGVDEAEERICKICKGRERLRLTVSDRELCSGAPAKLELEARTSANEGWALR